MSRSMLPRRGLIAAGIAGASVAGLSVVRAPSAMAAGGMQTFPILMPTNDQSGYTDTVNLYYLLAGQASNVLTTKILTARAAPPSAAPVPFTTVVLGPGNFYFGYSYTANGTTTDVPVRVTSTNNIAIIGMGPATTYCSVGGSFQGTSQSSNTPLTSPFYGVFAFDLCNSITISGMRFLGQQQVAAPNGTPQPPPYITTLPAASAITISRGTRIILENLYFEFINGWMIDYRNPNPANDPALTAPVSLDIHGIRGYDCAGGIRIEGFNKTVGASLVDCQTAQLGVSSVSGLQNQNLSFQNLDALFIHDAFDLTGTNLNLSVGPQPNSTPSTPFGHGFHFLGNIANVWFDGINSGGYIAPVAGSWQCGLMIEDDSSGGHASHINISHAVFQTWDVGFNLAGTGYNITLDHCTIANNQTFGGVIGNNSNGSANIGGGIRLDSCTFTTNGRDAVALQTNSGNTFPVNVSDLKIITAGSILPSVTQLATSNEVDPGGENLQITGSGIVSSGNGVGGTVRFCRFNSPIVAYQSADVGVQYSVDLNFTSLSILRFELNEFANTVASNNFSPSAPSLLLSPPS